MAQLTAALRGRRFDVFAFFGDGVVLDRVSKGGGEQQALQMVRQGDDDLGQFPRNRLGQLLADAGVRFALLNGSDTEWVARSLAKYVPAAIGMRETWRPSARLVLVESLFGAVLAASPLDVAVGATRLAIDRAEPGSGDWCRLIFYLQAAAGDFLLESPPQAEPAALAGQPPRSPAGEGADPQQRTRLRLVRLHDIALANLDAAKRRAAFDPQAARREVDALRDRADALAQQIAALRGEDR